MSLVEIAWPGDDEERPWVNDLDYNDPRRIAGWKAFERESILQRRDLGIPLNAEELAILAELERGHNNAARVIPALVSTVVDIPEVEPEKPERRRRKGLKGLSPSRDAIEYAKEENSWFT